jgi:hypothetical protein
MGLTTILRKKTGYGLGVALCVIGIILLLVVVWKWWDSGVFASSDVLSALSASFLQDFADISFGIGLRILHYIVLGVVLIGIGFAIFLLRREKVVVTEGVTVTLECPLCKFQWHESLSKSNLEAMGYPEARTLSRRKCAKCGKFIRPKIIEAS